MSNDTIVFPARKLEGALEREVRRVLGKQDDEITQAEFDTIKTLWLNGNDIVDVSGLQLPASLQTLGLDDNDIVDVSGLQLPASLQTLYLNGNHIVDVSGLQALKAKGVRIYGIRL